MDDINDLLRVNDVITVAGVFRDGAMDETRRMESANVQIWRVSRAGGKRLQPVLADGTPDLDSYWFGRKTFILDGGVISDPITKAH